MAPTMLDATLLVMSPTKTGKVRVSSTRYRNDPYRARVNPSVNHTSPIFERKVKAPAALKPAEGFRPGAFAAAGAPAAAPAAVVFAADRTPMMAPESFYVVAASVPELGTAPAPSAVSAAAPAKAVKSSGPMEHFALVGFKHETAMYRAPFRVAVGDVVIVEADRGEHVGVVQSITTTQPTYNVPSHIVRRATAAEMAMIDELTLKEKRVTAQVQKLAESFGLGIRVVDTEFQMDGNKLTVFFSSRVFVDFRKLQRSLFREYRCRIWLVNWAEVRQYQPVPVNAVN